MKNTLPIDKATERPLKRKVKGQMCPYCGKAAFYWKRIPELGDMLVANLVYAHESKIQPEDNTRMCCQWCNKNYPSQLLDESMISIFFYQTGKPVPNK